MSTTTASFRRIAAIAAATGFAAITTTFAASSAPAPDAPEPERPCFITQPRWNEAIDGPAPTCATPRWHREAGDRRTSPPVATIADCIDPTHRPVVKTCPYPIKSGDQFAQYAERRHVEVEHGRARIRP